MFTGIIEATAKVVKTTKAGLVLERPKIFDDIKIGSSIAVAGACLSVVAFDAHAMTFDVVPMTFSKTKLGSLVTGDMVNVERAMKADGRFEGHIVTGHIEAGGTVVSLVDGILTILIPEAYQSSVVPHGSITLDGVSLTVASVEKHHVSVALIPHTFAHTTLGSLRPGHSVNIETDILARYARLRGA